MNVAQTGLFAPQSSVPGPNPTRVSSPLYIPPKLTQLGADMTSSRLQSCVAGFVILLWGQLIAAGTPAPPPDFAEVYNLIKTHAVGLSDAKLNRAAVDGLLAELGSGVAQISNKASTNAAANGPLIVLANLYDGQVAYFRIDRVAGGLAEELRQGWSRLNSSNSVSGVVLDLRYADGDDYASSAAVADLFSAKSEPLLDWGAGTVSSHMKTNSIRVPVVVLVNRETVGAAEALAAALRETRAALILGSRTAGRATVQQEFPLATGGQLRIAVAPVKLGDGSPLPSDGVRPDVRVNVSPEDERSYYANAFVVLQKTNTLAGGSLAAADDTNLVSRPVRLNEAELVREHREGLDKDADLDKPPRPPEPAKPQVTDPVLARALDLVKGLAVVREDRY